MTNMQIYPKLKNKLILACIFSFVYLLICIFVYSPPVHAQAVSLAISPPVLEVMVAPGKEIDYDFVISNLETGVVLTPQLVTFIPSGENGETDESTMPPPSFVSVASQPIPLQSGASVPVTLKISPPADALERDYYLRLAFATLNNPDISLQNGSTANVRIASNILLTVSKNGIPGKNAKIVQFSGPVLTDSFFNLIYKIKIQNTGPTYFKPIGKITVSRSLGSDLTLDLAPQNVLSGSVRQISCINGETLVNCILPGFFHIGIFKASLDFNLDESAQHYQAGVTTIALPFSLIIGLVGLYLIYRSGKQIIKLKIRKKE